jgi:hypothetical protein
MLSTIRVKIPASSISSIETKGCFETSIPSTITNIYPRCSCRLIGATNPLIHSISIENLNSTPLLNVLVTPSKTPKRTVSAVPFHTLF